MPRITISEPGRTPQPYRLKTDRKLTKIGRGSDNDIILETGSASTYHCEMHRVEGGFILKDKDSTNGILLDDTRFQVIDLVDGLTVFIGDDIEYSFELSEEELEHLEEEDFEPHQKAAFPKSKEKKKDISLDEDEDEEYEEVVVRRKKVKKKKAVALDDDDEEENLPKKKSSSKIVDSEDEPKLRSSRGADSSSDRVKPRAAAPVVSSKSSGVGTTLIFAILAVAFLVGGMVIRHYQDHGTFLFEKQLKK